MGGFPGFGGDMPVDVGVLWYLDDAGKLAMTRIRKGVTDGRSTEIVEGRGLEAGMQVISKVLETEEDTNESRNPLATSPFPRRRR